MTDQSSGALPEALFGRLTSYANQTKLDFPDKPDLVQGIRMARAEIAAALAAAPAEGLDVDAIGHVLGALSVVEGEPYMVGPLTVAHFLDEALAEYARLAAAGGGE